MLIISLCSGQFFFFFLIWWLHESIFQVTESGGWIRNNILFQRNADGWLIAVNIQDQKEENVLLQWVVF